MDKQILANIKGAPDCAPTDQTIRNQIISTLRHNFEAFGFLPLETAMLNPLALLTNKYDQNAEIVREIYKLRDLGDRDLGLRFDLTVPFAKFIANNPQMRLPFKRYEIGKVWRNGPVKSGRAREFYQCDADMVGVAGVHAEAEILALAVKCYLDLGITPTIKYGHRKLLPFTDAVISALDKMAKVSHADLIAELARQNMTPAEAETLISSVMNAPKCAELVDLETELAKLGIIKYFEYAPYLARGLNIYTGTVWEAFAKGSSMTSSMGGGGRYDKIIGNLIGHGEYPAVGIGFGLEPITAVLLEKQKSAQAHPIDVMLIPLGTEGFCQTYANTLRSTGTRVLVYLGGKSIAKAFEYAASYGIPRCAIIGPDEASGKEIVYKEIK